MEKVINVKEKEKAKHLKAYLCPGSSDHVDGIVKHSSPPWKNLNTSPPNTKPTYFILDIPVP